MHISAARTALECTRKICRDSVHAIRHAASACRVFFLRAYTRFARLGDFRAKGNRVDTSENSQPVRSVHRGGHPLPTPGWQWVVAGSGLPGLHAPCGGDPHADEEAPRCGAAPGATTGQPGAPPAAAADRACQQQRQALSHGERPDPPVERGRPRSGDGALLCPAQFPGAPEPLAAHDLIGMNSVVLDQQRMLITDVFLHEDGHAQERRLIAKVLHHVQADDLWIEDRNFCTLGLMFGMARRGAVFVVRQHGQVQGELVGRLTRQGASRSGSVSEQALLVRAPDGGETMRVRRITVQLTEPPRNGETTLHILTNVPPPRASAVQLARVYGKRWSIETAFFEITTTLACEINTLGYPKAALFTFCLALLAYNAVSLIKAALRCAHGRQKVNEEVSSYYLSLEISRTYDGMMIAI